MPDWNLGLFKIVNGLAGRIWLLDSVVALSLANELIKSAPLGACLVAAWYPAARANRAEVRKALMLVVLAAVLTVGSTFVVSRLYLQPRPYLLTQRIYEFDGDSLHPMAQWDFRQPLDNRARQRTAALRDGNIPPEDFRAFPSDHAGLFLCLSLGLLAVSRPLGWFACAWTGVVILLTKVTTGMHAPLEIFAGASFAVLWLGVCLAARRSRLGGMLDPVLAWSGRHPSLTAGVLFLVVFEIASTFDHAKSLISAVQKHL